MVAKSYQSLPLIGEPYLKNGRQYIKVATKSGGTKEVRFYSEEEYYKMYPEETPKTTKIRTLKEVLGFENGYITLFKGNYDDDAQFLQSSSARYNRLFGWFCASCDELPPDIPDEVILVQLVWEDIAVDEDTLLGEQAVKRIVDGLLFAPSTSKHVGAIGDRITVRAVVKKVISVDGYYGLTYFHIFDGNDGNVYTWNTKTAHLSEGREIELTGTISSHDTYRNECQNKLVRCKTTDV